MRARLGIILGEELYGKDKKAAYQTGRTAEAGYEEESQ
jgi:hypothetical protein